MATVTLASQAQPNTCKIVVVASSEPIQSLRAMNGQMYSLDFNNSEPSTF